MTKITPTKPILLCLYGFPGAGKSYLARNLTSALNIAHVNADRIRGELFANPKFDEQENAIVRHLMNYMTEEFLAAGVSVVYDTNAKRAAQRQRLKDLAAKHRAEYLLVWLQIDADSAFSRTQRRDRRTADDKFAEQLSREGFNKRLAEMQNPESENYIVVSGKHAFVTQKNAVINRLYQDGLINITNVQNNLAAKPGLVNLVPNPHAGRVDMSRRNISIY